MIAGIEGVLKSRGATWVIVDVCGISFRVHTPTSTLSALGAPGSRVYLHTHLYVREDNLALYGFASGEEMKMFELLIGVSGVGPKVALSVLSTMEPERFAMAIASGDERLLSSVPGVGKKTAARLVLELRSKFEQAETAIPYLHEDVRAALTSLGYSAAEALSAVAALPRSPDLSLEEKVKLALRHVAGSS